MSGSGAVSDVVVDASSTEVSHGGSDSDLDSSWVIVGASSAEVFDVDSYSEKESYVRTHLPIRDSYSEFREYWDTLDNDARVIADNWLVARWKEVMSQLRWNTVMRELIIKVSNKAIKNFFDDMLEDIPSDWWPSSDEEDNLDPDTTNCDYATELVFIK